MLTKHIQNFGFIRTFIIKEISIDEHRQLHAYVWLCRSVIAMDTLLQRGKLFESFLINIMHL